MLLVWLTLSVLKSHLEISFWHPCGPAPPAFHGPLPPLAVPLRYGRLHALGIWQVTAALLLRVLEKPRMDLVTSAQHC